MPSDRARKTHDPSRMYRSVVSQQGRVTLEADANEAEEIRAQDARAQLIDVVGPSGSPDDGFLIAVPAPGSAPFDFSIAAGTLYLGGTRLQSTDRVGHYGAQANTEWTDYPVRYAGPVATEPSAAGSELIYLEVCEQEVSAVEDPALREVALGGPDTAARTRMIQRVQRVPVSANDCASALQQALTKLAFGSAAPALDRAAYLEPKSMRLVSTMRLKAGFAPAEAAADPCQPLAQAGFLGSENQLIRVQVSRDTAKFVWSYDNASFIYRATFVKDTPKAIQLDAAPVDVFHHPQSGQWLELLATAVDLDPSARVAAPHGLLLQIDGFDPDQRVVTLRDVPTELLASPPRQLFVRVWENRQDFAADDTTSTELAKASGVGTGVSIWTSPGPRMPGDYWMIGVRPSLLQAIPGAELGATQPQTIFPARLMSQPQPPDGPARWLVPLSVVTWTDGTTAQVTDCRKKFHNLVTPDECACDLDFHNQHLHGWGVVCGLQVECMSTSYADAHHLEFPREAVIVQNGYAIHPSGADIRLRAPTGEPFTALELGKLAESEHALTRDSQGFLQGSVSLWIDKDATLHVDPYDPEKKQTFADALKGTLLFDIYDDCLLKVVEYVTKQLKAPANAGPDTAESRRLISLLNLAWQFPNQTSGPQVFLSGPGANSEHAYLKAFFEGLKGLLASKTFCAMFDDIPYPQHDIYRDNMTPPSTIFGSGHHSELRVHPRFQIALSFGGSKIHVYHSGEQRLLEVVAFPVADADIQDLVFSPTDERVYFVAWTGSGGTDSVFFSARLSDTGRLEFETSGVECPGLKLCRLALPLKEAGVVYVTARGKGVYQFRLGVGAPQVLEEFMASGHLAVGRMDGTTVLYAGEHENQPNSAVFTRVRGLIVDRDGTRVEKQLYFAFGSSALLTGSGQDDLIVMPARARERDDPYAIVDGSAGHKVLLSWDSADANDQLPGLSPREPVDLGESKASRIAYSKQATWALVTYEDTNVGRVYRPENNTLDPELLHPLQIAPVSVATDKRGIFYVLEHLSGTVTVIPPAASGESAVDLNKLALYRYEVAVAFLKTVGRVVQYLKDCFCQHLLVNCPSDDGKVYLADVSFKDGKVYQICNFHSRKYVHTFPTVEYWLSIVPIVPMLKAAVEKVCCSVIGGFFDGLAPPRPGDKKEAPDKLSAVKLRYGLTYLKDADLSNQVALRAKQLLAGYGVARGALDQKLSTPSPGNVERVSDTSALFNVKLEDAQAHATAEGLEVRRVEVASDAPGALLRAVSAAPPPRGAAIDLLTDGKGRVIGWRSAAEPAQPVAQPGPVEASASAEVAALRRDLAAMTLAHDRQQQALEQTRGELAQMKQHFASMAATIETLRR